MKLEGIFRPPGYMSISHSIGLLSLLAGGQCLVKGYSPCADCSSTLAAVSSLGGNLEASLEDVRLNGCGGKRAGVSGGQAVVYIWGMRDHGLQEAAQFRAGDTISVLLRPWADVANQVDAVNRTELENENVQFKEPALGEVKN